MTRTFLAVQWKFVRPFVNPCLIFLLALTGGSCLAQDQQTAQGSATQSSAPEEGGPVPNTLTSLAGEFFEHDFINVFGFANGLFNSTAESYSPNSARSNSFGLNLGGGITAFHQFRDSVFSISYTGSWSDFNQSGYANGENQNLALIFSKRLSARWTVSVSGIAGIYLYGGSFGTILPSGNGTVVTNPFSPETKFANVNAFLSYRQTRRLSYQFGGGTFLNRYTYPGSIGSTGVTGTASAIYEMTARTSLSGSFTDGYFAYQRGAGHSEIEGIYITLHHRFGGHWIASVSGGATRSHATGIITIPLLIITNGQPVTGYAIGKYDRVSWTPTFQGSVSRNFRRTDVSVSGGQGVMPGNGIYLTSRDVFLNAVASHSFLRKSNTSIGIGYNRLTTVSNNVTSNYQNTWIGASFGYVLTRYISANVHYNYFRYGSFGGVGALTDNQIAFGITVSSKSIPLTLY